MTHYRFDNQIQKKRISRTRFFWNTFSLLLFVAISIFVIAPTIRNIIQGPAWLQTQVRESMTTAVNHLTPKDLLLARISELETSQEKNATELIELSILRDENKKLKEELSYIEDLGEFITARVIGKPSQTLYNSLLLDQGANHGVVVGQLVVTQGSIALGKVASVSARTATVELFSGPQFESDLVIKKQSITVPAKGKGGGNFEIHIPREVVVTDGDILTLPEHPTLAVGVVKAITFDPRDPFQTVLARTPVNIQELNFVEILK